MTRIQFHTSLLGMLLLVTTAHTALAMDAAPPVCDNGCETVQFDEISAAVRYDDAAHAARVQADIQARVAANEKLGTDAFPSTLIGRSFVVGPRTNPWSVADYIRRELMYAGVKTIPSHQEIAKIIADANPNARNIQRGIYIDGMTLQVPSIAAFVDGEGVDEKHQTWQDSLRADVADIEAKQDADAAAVPAADQAPVEGSGGIFGTGGLAETAGGLWGKWKESWAKGAAQRAEAAKNAPANPPGTLPATANAPADPAVPAAPTVPAPAELPGTLPDRTNVPAPAPAPAQAPAAPAITADQVQAFARLREIEKQRDVLDRRITGLKREVPDLEAAADAASTAAHEARREAIAAKIAEDDKWGTLFTSPSALFRDTEKAEARATELWDIYLARHERARNHKAMLEKLTTERAGLQAQLGVAAD